MPFILFIFAWFCVSTSLGAQPWSVEGKAGAFFPTSNEISRIFNTAMPFVEVEGHYQFCTCWDAWASVGCIFSEGHALGCGDKTSIQVYPFTIGVSRIFPITCDLEGFLGIGGLWSLYHNKDHSSSVKENISGNTFGGLAKGGVRYFLQDRLAVTLFTEYLYQKFSFHKVYKDHFTYRHDVNMSGISLGLGFSYDF